jgi:simple sugar transport system ATP-binding protein
MQVLRLVEITKRFGPLVANDAISLDLHAGEVLALLGENGAGKSTLVSILFGHYVADSGRVEVDGRPLPPGDTRAARDAGIGMVHQHFTLADNLSVLDNVMLGTEPLWQPFSRRAVARERLLQTARRFGLQVDPQRRVGDLSVGERQRVEILKALVTVGRGRGARALILDEPTAVLTPQESESLFATLAQLVAGGLAVIFISHKLDEVLRVSQRVAVLRGGRLVATLPVLPDLDAARLAGLMVGREVQAVARRGGPGAAPGAPEGATPPQPTAPVCELVDATVRGRSRGGAARPLLDRLSLALHAGEVVGIAGVSGNGQQVLADVLSGERALDAGDLRLQGRPMRPRPRDWIARRVARVPEDRQGVGAIGDLSIWENAVLEHIRDPAFSRHGWLRRGAATAQARALVEHFDVRGLEAQGLDLPARRLSGGNLQKLILGRALTGADDPAQPRTPALIVANQPTWGLDVGAVAYVHRRLLDAASRGSAVLLISDDLDELFALSDRIAVMAGGRLTDARPAGAWDRTRIGLAMAGADPVASPGPGVEWLGGSVSGPIAEPIPGPIGAPALEPGARHAP